MVDLQTFIAEMTETSYTLTPNSSKAAFKAARAQRTLWRVLKRELEVTAAKEPVAHNAAKVINSVLIRPPQDGEVDAETMMMFYTTSFKLQPTLRRLLLIAEDVLWLPMRTSLILGTEDTCVQLADELNKHLAGVTGPLEEDATELLARYITRWWQIERFRGSVNAAVFKLFCAVTRQLVEVITYSELIAKQQATLLSAYNTAGNFKPLTVEPKLMDNITNHDLLMGKSLTPAIKPPRAVDYAYELQFNSKGQCDLELLGAARVSQFNMTITPAPDETAGEALAGVLATSGIVPFENLVAYEDQAIEGQAQLLEIVATLSADDIVLDIPLVFDGVFLLTIRPVPRMSYPGVPPVGESEKVGHVSAAERSGVTNLAPSTRGERIHQMARQVLAACNANNYPPLEYIYDSWVGGQLAAPVVGVDVGYLTNQMFDGHFGSVSQFSLQVNTRDGTYQSEYRVEDIFSDETIASGILPI